MDDPFALSADLGTTFKLLTSLAIGLAYIAAVAFQLAVPGGRKMLKYCGRERFPHRRAGWH
jgi:hypothetical protein